MKRALSLLAPLSFGILGLSAADLPPDKSTEIPASAKRDVVIKLPPSAISHLQSSVPKTDLPDGYELQVVAASPLVTHPIMGCLDDRGRLFVGDATGVNWNKKQLEANPPNRILMLEDTDGDGIYDKSTVFADKLTFPQGGCWLNGSLYVCSPPSIWKLTDTTGNGVADKREEIVTGFEYTGNAADVHGPLLHPNGRLYWCHGRKGHKVTGSDGKVVHEGLASGIWSCKPDGTDVQWHSLGCGDNPVKVDFTPEGEIIGVQNLYYSNPRGDTIVHWLYGGVYERSDQMKAIEGLPRTLEHMPVMYNFGHVAVSGCCFWKSYTGSADSPVRNSSSKGVAAAKNNVADKTVGAPSIASAPLQFLVTHFNTQRVVRMELSPDGATYKATENEFLRLHDPDVHFTDVLEDADGSLIVLNTGGWFRIGCPSSLMAKPDALGAIYRVRKSKSPAIKLARPSLKAAETNFKTEIAKLRSDDPHKQCQALGWIAQNLPLDWAYDKNGATDPDIACGLVRKMMAEQLDDTLEHALIYAAQKMDLRAVRLEDLQHEKNSTALRRMLVSFVPDDVAALNISTGIADQYLDSPDEKLAKVALEIVTRHQEADERHAEGLAKWLAEGAFSNRRIAVVESFYEAHLGQPHTQEAIMSLLKSDSPKARNAAIKVLASQTSGITNDAWLPPLEKALAEAKAGDLPLLLDAIKKLKTNRFDDKLQAIANDTKQPLSLRLRALGAVKGLKLTPDTFAMLQSVLTSADSSAAARIQAATMLATAPLKPEDITALAPLFAAVGPIEFKELLGILKKIKDTDLLRAVSFQIAKNPVIASQQESIYRTALADKPADIFETIILPALRKADETNETKKRQLGPLAEKVIAHGDASAGRAIYESGKGTCIACHQIGDKGRSIGPNLSKIGAIRTERDILESIIFPSNTLARDYEAHIIETSDGLAMMGVIKSHTAEGLLVVDAAGQEKNIPHAQIVSDTQLTTSLMPMGLDQTLPEKELCDLVAYLRSLK